MTGWYVKHPMCDMEHESTMCLVLTVDLARVAFTRFALPETPARVWIGEERAIGFEATQIVPSWTARTAPGSWIEVELRARTAAAWADQVVRDGPLV